MSLFFSRELWRTRSAAASAGDVRSMTSACVGALFASAAACAQRSAHRCARATHRRVARSGGAPLGRAAQQRAQLLLPVFLAQHAGRSKREGRIRQ